MSNHFDVGIIGGGPAGITASIYASRAGASVVVFESYMMGGKVHLTAVVENYPGISSISGPDLATQFMNHGMDYIDTLISDEVISLEKEEDGFLIHTSEESYHVKSVILASGTKEKKLTCKGSSRLENHGISYCAVCDGPLYKNRHVAVIGGGNSALEEALYLSSICASVTLIHRREEFRGEWSILEKLKQKENVKFVLNAEVKEVLGEKHLEGLIYSQNGKENLLQVDALFPYIGQTPNASLYQPFSLCDEQGYVLVNELRMTSERGLFAAGDVIKKELRQISTAVSDGAIAGMGAAHYAKN